MRHNNNWLGDHPFKIPSHGRVLLDGGEPGLNNPGMVEFDNVGSALSTPIGNVEESVQALANINIVGVFKDLSPEPAYSLPVPPCYIKAWVLGLIDREKNASRRYCIQNFIRSYFFPANAGESCILVY